MPPHSRAFFNAGAQIDELGVGVSLSVHDFSVCALISPLVPLPVSTRLLSGSAPVPARRRSASLPAEPYALFPERVHVPVQIG